MKLASIHITDFLGVRAVDAQGLQSVTLFCGPNAAGKSSVRDAVALALTADLGRVSLKKEAGQLVRSGAAAAICAVTTSDGDEWKVMIKASGQITDSQKGRDPIPALPYALDGQRFARLPADERRAFLFGLMGVKADPQEITHRMMARRLDKARVERIVPLLRSGFAAAEAEAKRKASEARGAWKTVTGEAFGADKAKTWRAPVPAYDAAELKRLATEVEHADVAIGQWREQIGKLQAEEQRRQALRAKLPALQEHAAKVPRIEAKLAADDASMQAAQQELARVSAAAGAEPRVGLVHELAWAVDNLMFFGDPLNPAKDPNDARIVAALQAYEAEHGKVHSGRGEEAPSDPEAAARLPELRAQLELCERTLANDRRDLQAAQEAHAQAKAIADELNEAFDAAALADAREQVDKLQATRAAAVKALDALRSVKAVADAADEKTKQAAKHAADVAAWEAVAEQLAPSGIPGDLLREALAPITERLQQHAADTGWPLVTIDGDMAIAAGGRDYRLLSESERWRVDAVLAEAIAHLSGCRLLVLDRMDVLDLQGRADLLGWLDTLADLGEIDTALLFATLKAPPTGLGEQVQVEWIEAGVVGQQPLKAAA